MRKIKFKSWQKVTKIMFYNIEKGTGAPDGNPPFADYLENANMVIMQFTGLADKNGKDIYEGDIIQIMNPFSEKYLAYVVWDVARPMYHWMIGETWMLHFIDGIAKDENTPLYPYCQPRSGFDVTVVGNIHQNPELLPIEPPKQRSN